MTSFRHDLIDFSKNVYSAGGEDGLLEEMLNRIENKNLLEKKCLEVGASDGVLHSNTRNLVLNRDFFGIYIESSIKQFHSLKSNFSDSSKVYLINQEIGHSGSNTLDNLIYADHSLDVLSIDIDGMDWYIFESLSLLRPKIICIEYNPTIPNEVSYIQPENYKTFIGNSAKALIELGKTKQYACMAITEKNLIFVDDFFLSDLYPAKEIELQQANPSGNNPLVIFFGYDGTVLSNTNVLNTRWHGKFFIEDLQIMPAFLRSYPISNNLIKKICYKVFLYYKAIKRKYYR